MDSNKKYSPYHGVWAIVLCMIAVPAAFTLIIDSTLKLLQPQYIVVNTPSARFVGCGLGFLFHLILILSSVLREPFEALKFRIREFRENMACSFSFALRCYWDDMKQDGVVFDIYLFIILANLAYSLYNMNIAFRLLPLF